MQQQGHKSSNSKLLILSNSQKDYAQLCSVLSFYFPSANKNEIHLDTKYYMANISLENNNWPSLIELQAFGYIVYDSDGEQKGPKVDPQNKKDLLVMLVNPLDTFPSAIFDYVISKYNPENFILLVNTKDKNLAWQDEEKISNQVNNFIEIIKEDLQQLIKNPPERVKKGLLTEYEDGSIFNLFELLETTPWSNITRKLFEKKKQQTSQQPQMAIEVMKEQANQSAGANEIHLQQNHSEDHQMAQEDLQNEMAAFQNLIVQMKNLKNLSSQPQGVPDDSRKKKAQQLVSKLLGGWL